MTAEQLHDSKAHSCLVALVSMAVAARVFAVEHALRRTLLVVAITGATYLTVAMGLDVIPGWHVGGGDRAQPMLNDAELT